MTRDQNLLALVVIAAGALSGCASTPFYSYSQNRAPVEDRTAAARTAGVAAEEPAKPLPGIENAGKPGYYTIKPGDTLIRIALESGQNWKDLMKWNNLDNPNLIEVGQVVRVMPPGVDPTAATTRGVTTAKVETRPLDAKPTTPVTPAATTASMPAPTAPPPVVAPPPPVPAPSTNDSEDNVVWAWPATGSVSAGFDEGKSKGLSINGRAGDPVLAAADGRVVYAGSGLRGYGNLIILKHSNAYLTAYAHNQTLLVKDDQAVRRGQKIAEMGSSDSEKVKLHFEIRKPGGKPVDPSKLLPPR